MKITQGFIWNRFNPLFVLNITWHSFNYMGCKELIFLIGIFRIKYMIAITLKNEREKTQERKET